LFQPLRQGDMLPFQTPMDRAEVTEHRRLAKKQAADKGGTKAKASAKARPAAKRGAKKVPV
ncbi:MAG: hypothetical protein ACREDL_00275, partial [Bradyrhizobium sp.]